MSKIRTQKVVFFFLHPKLINIIFLRRPILDPKIPLTPILHKSHLVTFYYLIWLVLALMRTMGLIGSLTPINQMNISRLYIHDGVYLRDFELNKESTLI